MSARWFGQPRCRALSPRLRAAALPCPSQAYGSGGLTGVLAVFLGPGSTEAHVVLVGEDSVGASLELLRRPLQGRAKWSMMEQVRMQCPQKALGQWGLLA